MDVNLDRLNTMVKKVLLLDDDLLSLEFMRIFLEEEGFQVQTANSCAEATDIFHKFNPGVVVVDVELSDESGVDFANYVKDLGGVKVILASGHSREFLGDWGLNSALLDGILTKPLELSNLRNAVSSA